MRVDSIKAFADRWYAKSTHEAGEPPLERCPNDGLLHPGPGMFCDQDCQDSYTAYVRATWSNQARDPGER